MSLWGKTKVYYAIIQYVSITSNVDILCNNHIRMAIFAWYNEFLEDFIQENWSKNAGVIYTCNIQGTYY